MRSAVTVRGWFVGETVVTVDSPTPRAKSGKRPKRMEMEDARKAADQALPR